MTVFRAFLIITKRNLNIVILYFAIFLTISLIIQKSVGETETAAFSQERLNIAVINRDGGKLADGLTDYLGKLHNMKDIPDNQGILQDRLFYREVYYVVTIPKDFENQCLNQGKNFLSPKFPEVPVVIM